MNTRTVERIVPSRKTYEGEGFLVQRPFPTSSLREFDPFLLLDEMGPSQYGPSQAKGAPEHPHRGFETVTYLLAGSFRHRDSYGHTGVLNPGDVQWMTAGSGVVHSEMPEEHFYQTGGELHGVQLWINLPRRDKNAPPHYQEYPASRIPSIPVNLGLVHLIAGEALGAVSPIRTHIPILYLHAELQPGGRLHLPVAAQANCFAYILDGQGHFGDSTPARDADLALFRRDGDAVDLAADAGTPVSALIAAGEPIGEPVVRYGPFVMNTDEEIRETIQAYQTGHFGEPAV